ncbi:MetQ/NlpA family ABC transporter substrate-binding protein [Succinivibrio sp.]|uniref:MetQ/NlpA family ABC transporter substrate-binding protein n=1 Tax=Succinivibrio sp. TaxID=2053619 RepID=UPI0025872444|nr:MetQ/NlpA family ABC transporter substrate-binding protein [Succinivibrio sp.]MCI6939149.1 MetQ/NlpA family ABC transporter substrate-binding protein [Succinatimonas hippei]MDD6205826.1 MetQ/NlpA family ABC transporter substrate-binding protein [Succinivibrio sp.]
MKKLLLSVAALALSFSSNAAETLTIGATPVPHVEILEVVKPDLKSQGIDLKIVEFNDYVQPNTSVSDKLLDLNFFQHRPYLDSFIKDHGSDLVEVGGIHIEPIGFYSHKIKDLKDLKKGATIAIPNDPTNGGRALLLLQTAGLITLEDPKSISATPLDIKDNKLNLNIKELEAPQLPRSLDDVDGAIINTNYAIDAGLNPLKDALFIENADSPYVNVVVGNSQSVKKDSVKALLKALQSDKVKKFINDKYNGAVVAAF